MDGKYFKTMFGELAKANGFTAAQGGWFRQAQASLIALNLQKSNFGPYIDLNIKIYLDQTAAVAPGQLKELIKSRNGDIFRRQPNELNSAFDLESSLLPEERVRSIESMFSGLISEIYEAACCPPKLLRLRDEGMLFVLPGIEQKLRAH